MKLRMMNGELQKIRGFAAGLCIVFAGILGAGLSACTSDNTAGVLTETESGKTATRDTVVLSDSVKIYVAGNITGMDGKAIAMARVYLTDIDTNTMHSLMLDSTLSDDDGNYFFNTERLRRDENAGCFRVLAKGPAANDSLLGYHEVYNNPYRGYDHKDSLNMDVTLGKPATLQMYLSKDWDSNFYDDRKDIFADSVCIGGTFVCATISQSDIERGYFTIEGVPGGLFKHLYIWFGDKVSKHSSNWEIDPEKTFFWGEHIAGYPLDSTAFKLPESTVRILDSLGMDPILDSIPVPIKALETDIHKFHNLIDSYGNRMSLDSAKNETKPDQYWTTISKLGRNDTKAYWLIGGWGASTGYNDNSPLKHLYASAEAGLELNDTLFQVHHLSIGHCIMYKQGASRNIAMGDNCVTEAEWDEQDSSFAVSFWIKAGDTNAKKNSSKKMILSAITDRVGFEIAQCESDKEYACTKIYNGIDYAASDTTIYGKAKILDGEKHHVSFVIYKKHLAIAIDGETIRSTDLKLADKFYGGIHGIQVGDYTLSNFITYLPGSYVRKEGEKGWDRLKAWLNAFYELQK